MYKSFVVAGLLLLIILGSPARAADNPDWPEWLNKAMAMESRKYGNKKLNFGDGAIRSKVRAKEKGEEEAIDNGWYVPLDIGSDSPVECYVFTDDIDPGATTAALADLNMELTGEEAGGLLGKTLYKVDAGNYAASPWLALEWLYTVGTEQEKNIGLIKVRFAYLGERSLACTHNGLGYQESFANLFEELVTNVQVQDGGANPYYTEVYVSHIGDKPMGFDLQTWRLDENGDTMLGRQSSSLLAVDNQTLQVSDTWGVSYSTPEGYLINATTAAVDNGEVSYNLGLSVDENDEWLVTGQFRGKDLEQVLTPTQEPLADLGLRYAIRDLVADEDRTELETEFWLPEVDPTQLLPLVVSLDAEKREAGVSTFRMGPIVMTGKIDADGSMPEANADIGPVQVAVKRVFVSGSME